MPTSAFFAFHRRSALLVLLLGAAACDETPAGGDTPAPAPKADAKADVPAAPSPPAGMDGAKQLLAPFVAPGADAVTLSQALQPKPEDYAAVFEGDAAAKAKTYYEARWKDGLAVLRAPEQTDVTLWQATTEELTNEPKGKVMQSDAKHFPGGYSKAAPHLKKGLTFYGFRIAAPGKDTGMVFDGLVHVNGHWAIFPKPWVALGLESQDKVEKIMDDTSLALIGKFLAEQ
jgi:hypothetical protein